MAGGLGKILCCAKRVFVLFTISPYRGLKHYILYYLEKEVALRTTCTKNVKFKIIKIRTGCQYGGYFYYSENLNGAAQN